MSNVQKYITAICMALIIAGCTSKSSYTPLPFPEGSQQAIDNAAIIKYLDNNEITAQNTESGIYYVIEEPGSGEHPPVGVTVTTHYRGTTLDGKQFDSSYDKGVPAVFSLQGVIKGWVEGIPLLKPGGKGTLFIPSNLAYGARGYPGLIAPNTPLKFEVELIDWKDQVKEDDKIIASYCASKELEYDKTESGIYYTIDNPETGEHPNVSSKVSCIYEGTFLDGRVFDSSKGEATSFPLNQVITGWKEAIPLLKKGGKGTFIIPSHLAYGSRGYPPNIPPNTVLKFNVELVDF